MRDVIIGFLGFDLVLLFLWYVLSNDRVDEMKIQGNQRLVQSIANGLESYYADIGAWPQDLSLSSKKTGAAGLAIVGLNFTAENFDSSTFSDFGEVGIRGPEVLTYDVNHMIDQPIRDGNQPQPISDAWDTVFQLRPVEGNAIIVISAGPDKTYDTADDMTVVARPQPLAIRPDQSDYQRELARKRVQERREIERELQELRKKAANAE